MKYYGVKELSERLGMSYTRVYFRLDSPLASERWGVEMKELPDGTMRAYVPEDKLGLWKREKQWGRPKGDGWHINNRRKQVLLREYKKKQGIK